MRAHSAFSSILVFALAACGKASAPAPASSSSSPAIGAAPDVAHEPPAIGVPECDEYFKVAFGCYARLEPGPRAKAEELIRQNVDGWRGLAATPANREALAQDCKRMLEIVRNGPLCAPR